MTDRLKRFGLAEETLRIGRRNASDWQMKSPGVSKGVLLALKRGPFGTQKESFCCAKRVLLQGKTSPFEMEVDFGY